MSSACTPQRLLGRRVRKNFASCFFARRIRFEEKTNVYRSKSPETSNASIVFDFTGRGESGRASERKCKENEGRSVQNSPSHSSGGEAEPHVTDEDYLVFYFGEDGAINILNGSHNDNTATADAAPIGDDEIKNDEVDQAMEQFESRDSDTSSGSFAFPILKIGERIGSPVHMPKNGNRSVPFHLQSHSF